jgi:TRAP-type uncharacterized transport system substrate-binding protein
VAVGRPTPSRNSSPSVQFHAHKGTSAFKDRAFDEFRKLHPAFAYLEPKDMVKSGLSAPLHEGAARCKEKGWQ